MALDPGRIGQRAGYIRDQIRTLRGIPELASVAEFAVDPYLPGAARYALQTAIEALIDIAYHLAAKLAQHAPQDAHDAFATMAREGILDPADLPRYRDMLRFRNRVVHGYLDVDNARLYEMIQGQDLKDIEAILARFEAATARGAPPPHRRGEGRGASPGTPPPTA